MYLYYIDTDEVPRFFLLEKNHIFIARSEDTIFVFPRLALDSACFISTTIRKLTLMK